MYSVFLPLIFLVQWFIIKTTNANMTDLSFAPRNHRITQRSLLFPQFSVLQFTFGVSAPAIMPNRTINLSLALQQNYGFPFQISHLYPTLFFARESLSKFDIDREALYKIIYKLLDGNGINGKQCLLKTICEVGSTPLHTEGNSHLLERILHYIFAPSADKTAINEPYSNKTNLLDEAINAEDIGKSNNDCTIVFKECQMSLIDLVTSKFIIF